MATMKVELVPFDVPTHVKIKMPPGLRQDGIQPLPALRIAQLSRETVSELCDEMARAVMAAWAEGQPKGRE